MPVACCNTSSHITIIEIQNLNEIPSSLGKLSIAACAFQFAQALFLFILAARDRSIYYLFTNYPSEEDPQIPDPNEIASFSILWYAPVFIALSGLEHMSCLVFRSSYEWYVARNQNPFRWLEYSFSASTMRCFIAQLGMSAYELVCSAQLVPVLILSLLLAGVTDVHLLFCLFILTGVSIQYAATHEAINAKARADDLPMNWRPFWAGWIGHFATWLVIFNYVAVGNMHSSGSGAVTAIVVILFLLDLTFVINFALQWRRVGLWEGTKARRLGVGSANRVTHCLFFCRIHLWRVYLYSPLFLREDYVGLDCLWYCRLRRQCEM